MSKRRKFKVHLPRRQAEALGLESRTLDLLAYNDEELDALLNNIWMHDGYGFRRGETQALFNLVCEVKAMHPLTRLARGG